MRFEFDHIVDLEPSGMRTAMFGNEPDNRLIQYFIGGSQTANRSAEIILGNYANLYDELEDEATARITSSNVSRIGVKTLVGLGAYGFYVDANGEYSYILIPINPKDEGNAPPELLSLSQTDTTIIFGIRNPDIIEYETFRLTFRQGLFAFEFITYELDGEIEKPFDMEGDFSVTVIGYRNEISEFSNPTEAVEFSVTLRVD